MSDTSQGPGWWLASDGKWYPPEAASPPPPQQPAPPQPQQPAPTPTQQPPAAAPQQAPPPGYGAPPPGPPLQGPPPGYAAPAPGYIPPGPPQSGMNGCLKAFLIVFGLLIVGGIIVAAILVFAVGSAVHHASNEIEADSKAAAATCAGVSYPDKQSLDHCANGNGEVRDAGLTVTARNLRRVSVTATTSLVPTSTPSSSSELCADVTYHNRSSDTKVYSQVLWELQPPGGGSQAANLGTSGTLSSGTLAPGADTRGTVCFNDPGTSGQYVLVWHPLALTVDRGIWLFNVS
jgi:hypothetical protein